MQEWMKYVRAVATTGTPSELQAARWDLALRHLRTNHCGEAAPVARCRIVTCHCGKGPSLEECCGPIIEGERPAPTAEALMRARYSAYVEGAIDFVVASHHPDSRDEVDEEAARNWSEEADWIGLEIIDTAAGGADDESGTVEFVARFEIDDELKFHHERSQFEKKDGQWFFSDGETITPQTVRRATPKVGRNAPCPCGSGKKYKKCCGAAA